MIKNARADFQQITPVSSNFCYQELLPLAFILSTLACAAVAAKYQLAALMVMPLVIWFGGVPLLDKHKTHAERASGETKRHSDASPTEVQIAAALSILTLLMLALSEQLTIASMCLLGILSGLLIVIGLHYSVGNPTKAAGVFTKVFAAAAIIIGLAPQFSRMGQQLYERVAATPEDPASARMGENYYRFFARYVRGVWRPSFRTTGIVGTKELCQSSFRERFAVILLFGVYTLSLVHIGGVQLLMFIAAQVIVVAWQFSAFDYIERYGQMRKHDEAGRLEPLNLKHLWQGAGGVNNTLLNNRIIRIDGINQAGPEESLKKTYGYGFNFLSLVVLSPLLWFRYANPLLATTVDFDLAKVNLDGNAYVELTEAYHRAEG